MLILLVVLGVGLAAIGLELLVTNWRRRRPPASVNQDWWEEFERDFRAYAARMENRRRHETRERPRPHGAREHRRPHDTR